MTKGELRTLKIGDCVWYSPITPKGVYSGTVTGIHPDYGIGEYVSFIEPNGSENTFNYLHLYLTKAEALSVSAAAIGRKIEGLWKSFADMRIRTKEVLEMIAKQEEQMKEIIKWEKQDND